MAHLIVAIVLVALVLLMGYKDTKYITKKIKRTIGPRLQPKPKNRRQAIVQDDSFCAQKELEEIDGNNQFINLGSDT